MDVTDSQTLFTQNLSALDSHHHHHSFSLPNLSKKPQKGTTPQIKMQLTSQPRQPNISQPILRQHAPNRAPQYLGTAPFLHQPLQTDALQAARPRRVRVVRLLLQFATRHAQMCAVGRHHVVAAVGRWVISGLVLAHEGEGDAG
jgi:hypothetical protein